MKRLKSTSLRYLYETFRERQNKKEERDEENEKVEKWKKLEKGKARIDLKRLKGGKNDSSSDDLLKLLEII